MTAIRARLMLATFATALTWCGLPHDAQAQSILKRLKDQTAKRVQDGRAKIDSTVMKTAGTAVDSAVTKTGRGADAVAGRVTNVANGALAATERGVTSAFGGSDPAREMGARLAAGRLVLEELRFVAGSDQLDASAEPIVKQLASVLTATTGTVLIEGHLDGTASAADAQALSQKRASAVKAKLVASGVSAERMIAVGYGATRPNTANPQANARIEIVRAQ